MKRNQLDAKTGCGVIRKAVRLFGKIEWRYRSLHLPDGVFRTSRACGTGSVVILEPEMRNQLGALEVAQSVLELHKLDEQIMLRIEARHRHRRLEIEAEPLLDAQALKPVAPLRQVEEQDEGQNDRCGENRIPA